MFFSANTAESFQHNASLNFAHFMYADT